MCLDGIPPAVEANLLLIKACVLRCRTGKTLLGHLKVFKCPKVLKFTCHLCHGKSISISHVLTQCGERLCLFETSPCTVMKQGCSHLLPLSLPLLVLRSHLSSYESRHYQKYRDVAWNLKTFKDMVTGLPTTPRKIFFFIQYCHFCKVQTYLCA